jgi:hypothetical protein
LRVARAVADHWTVGSWLEDATLDPAEEVAADLAVARLDGIRINGNVIYPKGVELMRSLDYLGNDSWD